MKNNEYQQKIETLGRDIDIHKEVEKELAKRSHYCQRVIKRLKQRVSDLEAEKEVRDSHPKPAVGGVGGSRNKRQQFATAQVSSQNNDDLINFLEHKLEEIEKKLSKTQQEYELLQSDYLEL